MKKKSSKKSVWQSVLSVVVLGVFILLSLGSEYEPPYDSQKGKLSNGETRVINKWFNKQESTTGTMDDNGIWQGYVSITHWSGEGSFEYLEKVKMVDGLREGISTETDGNQEVKIKCYKMDVPVACEPIAAFIKSTNYSAFQILNDKYPWYLFSLNGTGFDNNHVQSCLDTIDMILNSNEFDVAGFDDYYLNIIDELGNTKYDSLLMVHEVLAHMRGMDILKKSEFRLALLASQRSEGKGTFDILQTTYPGYLQTLNYTNITDSLFEIFCFDFDSLMNSYESLDLEDILFVDSVDTRMFRALLYLYSYEESSSESLLSLKSVLPSYQNNNYRSLRKTFNPIIEQVKIDSLSGDIAFIVLYYMYPQFSEGDKIRLAVKEAYNLRKGIVTTPVTTTEFLESPFSSSARLNGFVIEDGRAEVTERGITWATYYNPTIEDNLEPSGTGLGEFMVTLHGLSPGTTYYARSYAINSAGISYGNCIQFTAGTTGIEEISNPEMDFKVFPNPASQIVNISFHLESSDKIEVMLVDVQGKIYYQNTFDGLQQGHNQMKINLSGFKDGIYNCRLLLKGDIKSTQILKISQ